MKYRAPLRFDDEYDIPERLKAILEKAKGA